MKRRLITIAAASIPVLALLAAITIGMAFALQSDIALVAKRAREALRTEKALRAEMETLKDSLVAIAKQQEAADVPAPAAVAAADTAEPDLAERPNKAPARRAIQVAASGRAYAVKASATVPPECIFRAGGSAGLMECLRQQQDRIGVIPARSL